MNALKFRTGFLSYLLILLITIMITMTLYYINGQSWLGMDDANIYMVYMRNFAGGHGFVYNVGGERVEGFTSLLWTLTGSLFYRLSPRPEICLLILNMLVVSYAIWRVCCFINTRFNKSRFLSDYVIFFLLLLIALPGYFEWTVLSLMETGLWSSFIILSVLNLLEFNPEEAKKSEIQFFILICLTILCRPEAILWCAFFVAMRFLKIYSRGQIKREAMRRMILPALVYILSIAGVLIWRHAYFGYLFPNTYYAKVSSDRLENIRAGMKYLVEYFKKAPFVFLIFILFLKQLITRVRGALSYDPLKLKQAFPFFIFTGIFGISLFIPLFSGGDHFAFYRMMQPTVPLFILYFFFSAEFFQFRLTPSWKALILFFVLVSSDFSLFYSIRNPFTPLKVEWVIAVADRKTSEKLNDYFALLPHYPSQGVITAGGSAYAYKGETIDLLGLNNVQMAHANAIKDDIILKDHASFDKNVFYHQHPDLFWLLGDFKPNNKIERLNIPPIHKLIFKGISDDERFNQDYTQCIIIRKDRHENLQIFASKKFLNTLDTSYYTIRRFN
jgi:arabinofuranosyltransferase